MLTRIWRNWNPQILLVGLQLLWKTIWKFLKTLNIVLPYDSSILHLVYTEKEEKSKYSNKYMYTHIHSITIHNSPKVETAQMSSHGWRNKQIVMYIYNGILFSHKKRIKYQCMLQTLCSLDESWKHYAKWKKPGAKGHILYDHIYRKCSE